MSSVDEEPKTILDSTADYVSSKIFGPIEEHCDETTSDDEDADEDEETTRNKLPLAATSRSNKSTTGVSNDVKLARKSSLHVIATTLAKIAHVKPNKEKRTSFMDRNSVNNDTRSLESTLESQLESFMDVIDPESMDHIVVDDGKEISIHAIRKTNATALPTAPHVEELQEHTGNDTQETMSVDPTAETPDMENMTVFTDLSPTEEKDNEESLSQAHPTTSFADCICPFTSQFQEPEQENPKDETNQEVTVPFDEEITVGNVTAIENVAAATIATEVDGTLQDDTPIQSPSNDDLVVVEDTNNEPEENKNSITSHNMESIAESTVVDDAPSSKPFSFLSYINPLSPVSSINNIQQEATKNEGSAETENVIDESENLESNLESNSEVAAAAAAATAATTTTSDVQETATSMNGRSTPTNPPAKWSIFNPFVTSYVDLNRNTDIYGKDPVGNQIVENNRNVENDKDVEAATAKENGLDPIGAGPILFTYSVDKSVTPPWDRIDPPTACASTTSTYPTNNTTYQPTVTQEDIESPATEDGILSNEMSLSKEKEEEKDLEIPVEGKDMPSENQVDQDIAANTDDMDDVECTMAGPVEKIVFSSSAMVTSSALSPASSSSTSQNSKAVSTKYSRCKCIIILLLLLVAVLTAGIYFAAQSNMKKSTRVVSASQVDDSINPTKSTNSTNSNAKTKTSKPATRLTLAPTASPVISVALITNAPTLQPTAVPSNPPSFTGTSSTDDDSGGDNDDDSIANADDDNIDDDGGGSDDVSIANTDDDDNDGSGTDDAMNTDDATDDGAPTTDDDTN